MNFFLIFFLFILIINRPWSSPVSAAPIGIPKDDHIYVHKYNYATLLLGNYEYKAHGLILRPEVPYIR